MAATDDAIEALSRPGAIFETVDWQDGLRSGKCWKNGRQTLLDVFKAAKAHGDKPFLACGDLVLDYGSFCRASDKLMRSFISRGIRKGDVVVLSLLHEPEWIAVFFALARLGAICAPINPASDKAELSHLLDMARAKALICDEATLSKTSARELLEKGISSLFLSRSVASPNDIDDLDVVYLVQEIGDAAEWTHIAPETQSIACDVHPDDAAVILFTSGTTGRPKGVVLSHRCFVYSVFHAGYRNARRGIIENSGAAQTGASDVLLLVLPLFHASGSRDALIPLMVRGGLIVTMPFWSPGRAAKLIAKHGVTIIAAVPSIAEQLLKHHDYDSARGSVKQVICGGAPPSANLSSLISASGAAPGQNWGMTETGGAAIGHIGQEFLQRPRSCGRPAPVLEVRVVNDTGENLPANQVGELQVRGPQVMKGYWCDEALTEEYIVDGWLKTGDVAFLDDNGYCTIVDRAKDMIIMAGENIYCSEIEHVLRAHPKIEDAAVVGMPHSDLGERPLAVVVIKDGVKQPSEMDIRIFVAGFLPPAKIPSSIIYSASALPRNAMGKIEKAKIRRELLEGASH